MSMGFQHTSRDGTRRHLSIVPQPAASLPAVRVCHVGPRGELNVETFDTYDEYEEARATPVSCNDCGMTFGSRADVWHGDAEPICFPCAYRSARDDERYNIANDK